MKKFAKCLVVTSITFGLGAAYALCTAFTGTKPSTETGQKPRITLGIHRISLADLDALPSVALSTPQSLDSYIKDPKESRVSIRFPLSSAITNGSIQKLCKSNLEMKELSLYRCHRLTNESINNLPRGIIKLNLGGTAITDLSPLKNLTNLQELTLPDHKVLKGDEIKKYLSSLSK